MRMSRRAAKSKIEKGRREKLATPPQQTHT